MNYEEKYKNALGWMRSLYDGLHGKTREEAECYFPELKESDDERIRKEIIDYIKTGTYHKDWISWLEKQGEKKPANKIEPMFNVGDKIQYSKGCGTIMTIEKIENGEYIFSNNKGHTTIESGNKWYLVNTVEQNPTWGEEDENMYRKLHNLIYAVPYCDSRKEFSDWLKSIKDKVQSQPKQEWGEEDKAMLDFTIRAIELCRQYAINHQVSGYSKLPDIPKRYEELRDWLKSLKPHNRWKPSDEQIKVCKEVYADILSAKGFDIGTVNSELNRLEEQLKKLREE